MAKDYKDTLHMMNTEFSMRANLNQKEPVMVNDWESKDIYHEVLKKNAGKPTFILHDGPPYANGSIHVGHALNKILKDFIVRYKSMTGFNAPYVPGWDTHGLPIENALTKNSKVNRKELSVSEFRRLCEEYALKQVEGQKEGFKRLGVIGDFNHPYVTLDKDFEAEQIRIFGKMASKGYIYKGLKPVYWSPSSETALAEAEIEYHDITSPSIYLAFKVKDGKGILKEDEELVIWTTTPWTIPANLAVSVNGNYTYIVVSLNKFGKRKFVVAKELLESFINHVCDEDKGYKIDREFKGFDLEYVTYFHPLNDRICPVICGDHVTLESGTGLVHTAPGHGEDDYNVGKKYNLEVVCPVDSRGFMTEEAGEFAGLFYEKAQEPIMEKLAQKEILLKAEPITHSYPHDWRTNKPIIFRATAQWFASIDDIKEEMLSNIANVKWNPSWGEVRISNMVKDREAWCISRQRVWGVPIPVFYCEDGEIILDNDVINHVADLFSKYGSNVWFEKEAKDLLPAGYTNPHSPNGIFTKETDIMDVWFDSGSSHQYICKREGYPYPVDLYLEGADQYRGWFNSSLSTGVAVTGKAPYKEVLTHGFVLDGAGNKMSKSLGNTIDPLKVCQEFGADILRLWCASVEYTADVRISIDIIKQNAEAYRKIRNTFRFLLGNVSDYDDEVDHVEYGKLSEVDRYMVCKLNDLLEKAYKAYNEYNFSEVYRLVLNYMTNDLSAFYLDFTKDILYIEAKNNLARRSIQTVFYMHLDSLLKLLTPMIPFTCEEIYSYMNGKKALSVALLDMNEVVKHEEASMLFSKYDKLMSLRDDILKAIEEARNEKIIGKSLSALVEIKPTDETKELLASINADPKTLFIVSEFKVNDKLVDGQDYPSGKIKVSAREGVICARCWQVVDHVNEDELCDRCQKVLEEENNGN